MNPADVASSLKALALTQKPLVTATSAISAATAFEPGQQLQASVLAQLAPGIFKVQVANQLLQLHLPGSIRTGDKITLQVVSLLPRLTFNMAASANPLSTSDQLSATARLLSSLTQQPLEKSFVRPTNSAPLWSGALQFPETTELAGKLHTTLSQSGLFYESHQAQWVAGSRNIAQILQEPQNLPANKFRAALGLDKQTNNANTEVTLSSVSTGSGTERVPIAGIPDHLQTLIQQQLNALETRQVQWQGQIWPNQEMNWKIQEEAGHSAGNEEAKQWATQIQLDLPNLGEVTATLRFGIGGVSITLDAAENATRTKLGTASSALVSAMSEHGISVTSTLVTQRTGDATS